MADASSGRTEKIWRDGELVNWEDATLHVMSHVVHYGSSVFEGIRCYDTPNGGAVFRLREHMRRLLDSARIYRMPLRYTVDELVQATVDTVAANDLRECYLRPIVVRTGQQMGFYPVGVPVECFIIAYKWPTYLGHDALEQGVDVCVSSWRRAAPDTFPTMAKAGGNYLNSQLSKLEAKQNEYSEGIMLDAFGYVAEGSGENLFIVRDGVLYTSGISSGILHGITRDTVITLARDFGYEVREQQIPREMLYIADEMFFTGTAAELTPIRSVDRVDVGEGRPGEITRRIQSEFMGIAKGRLADRFGWLTPVPATALSR
ncbi:MAG: branched chain amino acid aminotransferase [Gemmatimonadetes bacterium SCN 70-22]|jgi:branched-chain amino acid aminotransferase|nr:MAG: branched chain amino acid aminotransferase [Gemmatimonadetes bacterium SCN 70-22]